MGTKCIRKDCRGAVAVAVAVALSSVGCGGDGACTVTDNGLTATILCPDGSETVVSTMDTDTTCLAFTDLTTGERWILCGEQSLVFPANTLASIVVEAPGANCLFGGQAVMTGKDINADGVLQASEVDATAFVCEPGPETVLGSVVLDSVGDLHVLASTVTVEGDLQIDNPGVATVSLGALESVGGTLSVAPASLAAPLKELLLPKLTSIGTPGVASTGCGDGTGAGDLMVMSSSLQSLDLPLLGCVEGQVAITGNEDAAFAVSLGALSAVGSSIRVEGNMMASIDVAPSAPNAISRSGPSSTASRKPRTPTQRFAGTRTTSTRPASSRW